MSTMLITLGCDAVAGIAVSPTLLASADEVIQLRSNQLVFHATHLQMFLSRA
jgi:hypothetical protein